MKYNPHEYQKYATEFILNHPVAAVLLEMGLGKSVITLTAIYELMLNRFEVGKVLVIAPLRVARDTWPMEIEKWDHLKGLTYSVVIGTESERKAALKQKANLYLINRENVDWLITKSGYPFDYDMVVIDELSSFKSAAAKRFKSLLKVRPKVKRIVGLTGTPSSNGLMDLWAEFRLLDMGERLGRFITHYRNNFFIPDKRNQQMVFSYKPRAGAEDAIYRLISDITISMKSADYLKMPKCLYNEVEVKLSDKECAVYDELRQEMVVALGDEEIDAANAAALSGKLLQMAKCNPINILGMEIKIPFETILKRDYCGMKPASPEEMIQNDKLRKNKHIISLQMLLILLKKVIIYGNYSSLKVNDYEISEEDYREVIMLQLLVADEVSEKHKKYIDTDHFLYSTYHLNYQRNVANEFQRMYYMMECLSTNPQIFDDDIQAEYKDYYGDFTSRYGVTPTEYSSLLFWELQYYYSEKNALSQSSCWRNIDLIYKDAKEKEKISKVIDILKIEPIKLKEWAEKTETEEWNFTLFYSFPFISDGKSDYISISDITLINAFFEKVFWLIRDCYSKEDSRAMAFFGRLFERYIQDATKDACANDYTYIDEYLVNVKKGNQKSSDAYIRKGNDLLVVEAKGFSVLVDCMAKNERIETNNRKLFINPVLQADKCLNKSFDTKEEFNGIEEAFIISVTLDNINAVPNYYNAIHKEIDEKKKCGLVHYYFNFSIEEYEMLLFLIECEIDIFPILQEYFTKGVLSPFSNYVRERVSNINMTKFMERNYKAATDKMKRILW